MNWNIKDHGESIEKLAASNLESKLISEYNLFWGFYIGHRNGMPIDIVGIDKEQNRKRLFLGQSCYTLLQNALFLNELNVVPNNIKTGETDKVVRSLRIYFEATHLLYNSIEIVDDYNSMPLFKNEDKINTEHFYSFKKFRNAIAHGIKPQTVIDSSLHVIKNIETFDDWREGDYKVWTLDSFGKLEFWPLQDFIDFVIEKNSHLLFELLKRSQNIMKRELGGKTIGTPSASLPSLNLTGFHNIITSGSNQNYR